MKEKQKKVTVCCAACALMWHY